MTELEKCQLAKQKGYTYCPVSGELKGVYGKVIKTTSPTGYIKFIITFNNRAYNIRGHRLAWFLYYGCLPKNQIDHIDGNRLNNKINNLRDVTHQQNHMNRTTAKGYSWSKSKNKFIAYININKNTKHLGYYTTEQEARNAYLKAKEIYHVINA